MLSTLNMVFIFKNHLQNFTMVEGQTPWGFPLICDLKNFFYKWQLTEFKPGQVPRLQLEGI